MPTHLASGGALHVDGPAGAAPVLFLHGIGGGAWSWEPQRAALSATRRVFVAEVRGHGSGAPVADLGLADWYVDAKEALAAVLEDARQPAFVVGHSIGGLLAMALACDVAAGIAGLFLVDPVYLTGEELGVKAWLPVGRAAAPLFGPFAVAASRAMMRPVFARQFEDKERMEKAWALQRLQDPPVYRTMMREAFTGPKGFRLHDFAKEISDPTFLIEGSSGRKAPRFPRLVATLRERLGEDFAYEAIPGGHYLQLDRPDVVNDRLERFLQAYAIERGEVPR